MLLIHHRRLVFLALLALVCGCASIPQDFKQPSISVLSVAPSMANGLAPNFDIVLRVTNPNSSALKIAGMSYTIDLLGRQIIEGVASDLPRIAAYAEADVEINARVDLLGGYLLIADLAKHTGDRIDFEFNAEINLGAFYPMINVKKTGAIQLR